MSNFCLVRSNIGSLRHSARTGVALVVLLACLSVMAPPRAEAQANSLLRVRQVVIVGNQLQATIGMGSQVAGDVIQTILITTSPSASPACPILHLRLNSIHLNLLGLDVLTSDICLDITAQPGGGNLLGNLLCAVARLLDRGVSLGDILGRLSPQQTQLLLSGIRNLLQGALDQIVAQSTVTNQQQPMVGCPILHLELGPLTLNLLGLVVNLNNCANPTGPVTVDITAIRGALLGDLLCRLTGGPRSILTQLLAGIP